LALVQEARILHFPIANVALPLDALAEARANLTIVCSPNSPSGTLTPSRDLGALAKRLEGRLLVIDEAYVDFADENALGLVRRHRNVVILRTLSKSYSLAGMRLGLCFAHPSVIDALMKVKDSYNLNRVALAAGAEALRDGAWMRRNVARVIRTRARTESRLRALGFEVPPSQANFVLARMPGRNMAPVVRGLRRAAILVRHFATPMLEDAIRISIGTPAEMNALFKALAPLVRAPRSKSKSRARA
jgi:histidinol-phosphate aminotransferase